MDLVTLDELRAAAARVPSTKVLKFLDELWLKPENQQPTGSFKIRGATNAIAELKPEAVITHSSGNHGAALTYAAKAAGVPCTVVVPDTAPTVKIDAMRALGAELVVVAPDQRFAAAERRAAKTGATLIPPFDNRHVIAGQGTIGLEIVEELPGVEAVLVPIGGGGLISGVAAAVKSLRPDVKVIGVEPELAADAQESLQRDRLIGWSTDRTYRTVADGVRTGLSLLTFAHLREYVDDIVTVSEDEILRAVGELARFGTVAEPSGALTTAAYMYRRGWLPAGRTVAVISGGNVDPELLRNCLA
ncbi:threonine ammonia-lyase [Allorhizocola rhizosphaerae]|uniref:threonine ammonia-lyase n=1 Tax=Allorhizocola rhizosphaerae TaxID=1872709 RepID=UPI000E3C1D72|nr:threonine/serine dehydratase [Allorhizocola rhizosphaerae]